MLLSKIIPINKILKLFGYKISKDKEFISKEFRRYIIDDKLNYLKNKNLSKKIID